MDRRSLAWFDEAKEDAGGEQDEVLFDEQRDDADSDDVDEAKEDGVLGRVRGWTAGRVEGEFAVRAALLEVLLGKFCVLLGRRRGRRTLVSLVPLRVSVGDVGGGLVPSLSSPLLRLLLRPESWGRNTC